MKKYVAELIGTMVLVLLGCGSAVFAGGVADTHRVYPDYGYICEPGTKHRTGPDGRRTGHRTALALYRGTFRGSSFQCIGVEIPSY